MSILEYNGGSVIAMVGDGCVAIASDLRFGIQAQTVSNNFSKVFEVPGTGALVGLSGLATDIQTVEQIIRFRSGLYSLREDRPMKPSTVGHVISSLLYEKRFGPYFVEPVVCGLEGKDSKPYIVAMDLIGAPVFAEDFVVAGTSSEALYGLCETFWKPNMGPDELFEVLSQAFLAAINRDAITGWGAEVTILTPTKIIKRTLKTRQD
ncbi:MAG: proteasome subunit beta type-3 [archaeon]|nr:proteasome subunit beta type-3 [archaeon]